MDTQSKNKAIFSAVRDGDRDRVLSLIEQDHDLLYLITPLGSLLHIAAGQADFEMMEMLIDLGLDVNTEGWEDEGFALDVAAGSGNLEAVKYLHEQGGILDTSESQRNPLFATIVSGHPQVARYLIDQGIDVTLEYKVGDILDMDALKFAQHWGRTEIVEMIEQRLSELGKM